MGRLLTFVHQSFIISATESDSLPDLADRKYDEKGKEKFMGAETVGEELNSFSGSGKLP